MYNILILVCSLTHPGEYGCGPRSHIDKPIVVGTAKSEGECFKQGNAELKKYSDTKYKDTNEIFHKVICVR